LGTIRELILKVTGMALWNNLEIGALIERGEAARMVSDHFRALVAAGALATLE
jgi:hypothetical protein